MPRALYICDHKTTKKDLKDHPIISDLAGKKRNIYKTEEGLRKLLKQFCENHDYTKRFDTFLKKYWSGKTLGQKKRKKAICLKILHVLDEKDKVRRCYLVSSMLGLNYTEKEIEDAIKALHQSKFITASMGRYSDIYIREK
ncbi:MAG: hypothetical protein Q8O74_01010 [bacterium]|nr:hypothetical protein [bacterium]